MSFASKLATRVWHNPHLHILSTLFHLFFSEENWFRALQVSARVKFVYVFVECIHWNVALLCGVQQIPLVFVNVRPTQRDRRHNDIPRCHRNLICLTEDTNVFSRSRACVCVCLVSPFSEHLIPSFHLSKGKQYIRHMFNFLGG